MAFRDLWRTIHLIHSSKTCKRICGVSWILFSLRKKSCVIRNLGANGCTLETKILVISIALRSHEEKILVISIALRYFQAYCTKNESCNGDFDQPSSMQLRAWTVFVTVGSFSFGRRRRNEFIFADKWILNYVLLFKEQAIVPDILQSNKVVGDLYAPNQNYVVPWKPPPLGWLK